MLPDDKIMMGVVGTAVSATGAGLSVTELQAIISIIVTIAGFIISVLIPLIIKIVKKVKAAKEDGVITKEEVDDIASSVKEIVDESSKVIEEVSHKEKEKK
jgi:predicted membrane-bound spermidine synthase